MVSLLPLGEVKVMRLQAGLTQTALAELAGVSQSLIAKIENGKVDPSYSAVQGIFSALESYKADKLVTVREMMHFPVTVSFSDSLRSASVKMKRLGISQLPVVKRGRVAGLVSESGLISASEQGGVKTVADVMEPAPPLVSESTPASVLPLILKHCPLVGITRGEKLVGVITKSDLLE